MPWTLGDYVLASNKSVYNFYLTLEAAQADLQRANADSSFGPYTAMTYDEYRAKERAFWLGDAPVEITRERFIQALEVLPPLRWIQEPGYNSFLMSEFMSGNYTNQYVRYGTGDTYTYWVKMVDATDRTTWLQRDAPPALLAVSA